MGTPRASGGSNNESAAFAFRIPDSASHLHRAVANAPIVPVAQAWT